MKFSQAVEEVNVGPCTAACRVPRLPPPLPAKEVLGAHEQHLCGEGLVPGSHLLIASSSCHLLPLPPCLDGAAQTRSDVLGDSGPRGDCGCPPGWKGGCVGTCHAQGEGAKAEHTAWGPLRGHRATPGAPPRAHCLLKYPGESKSSGETLPWLQI